MALNSFYSPSPLTQPQLGTETRFSSISSASSLPTFSPQSNPQLAGTSRELCLRHRVSGTQPGSPLVPGTRCHHYGRERSAPHAVLSQFPSLIDNAPSYSPHTESSQYPLYRSISSPRQLQCPVSKPPAPAPTHSYSVMTTQPPSVTFQEYPTVYSAYIPARYQPASVTTGHLSSTIPHASTMLQQEPYEGLFDIEYMKRLPESIIERIKMYLRWRDCLIAYTSCRFFRDKFNPDSLPYEVRRNGLRDLERFPDDNEDQSVMKRSAESKKKKITWYGCYGCLRPKPLRCFELYKWNNKPIREYEILGNNNTNNPRRVRDRSNSPQLSSSTTTQGVPPTGNPHYDPSLTRTSLMAANKGHRNLHHSGDDPSNSDLRRIRDTWGKLRLCVECSLACGVYKPLDTIDLVQPQPDGTSGYWVCRCVKLHRRGVNAPRAEIQCSTCHAIAPLSRPW